MRLMQDFMTQKEEKTNPPEPKKKSGVLPGWLTSYAVMAFLAGLVLMFWESKRTMAVCLIIGSVALTTFLYIFRFSFGFEDEKEGP